MTTGEKAALVIVVLPFLLVWGMILAAFVHGIWLILRGRADE